MEINLPDLIHIFRKGITKHLKAVTKEIPNSTVTRYSVYDLSIEGDISHNYTIKYKNIALHCFNPRGNSHKEAKELYELIAKKHKELELESEQKTREEFYNKFKYLLK